MSTLGISNQEKINRMPFHRRNDSDELDVFEASNYFSCTNDVFSCKDTNMAQKHTIEEKQGSRVARVSLDMPVMRNPIPPSQSHKKETSLKEKRNKPPSSPGGKLASFLNSLFNQTSSKKKTSKPMSHSMGNNKDENSGGKKRRSSISHFESSFSKDSKFSTSTISGFRTPPPYVNGLRTYTKWNSSHSDIVAPYAIKPSCLQNEATNIEEFKFIANGTQEKPMKKNWIYEKNNYKGGNKIKRFDEMDEGWESDTSSDLFELENYSFGYCSSELPVYETTHIDNITKGPPISNGAVY